MQFREFIGQVQHRARLAEEYAPLFEAGSGAEMRR
jgi:hypothetical protein